MITKSICGRIAIVGKPNVGKSTLINSITNEPISIATHKAQTTRHCILGIKTYNNIQLIFIDTPGIHTKTTKLLNNKMNKTAGQVLHTVDLILWLTDRMQWDMNDKKVANYLSTIDKPIIWCINKIDRLKSSEGLKEHIEDTHKEKEWIQCILPISARTKFNLKELEDIIIKLCPYAPHCYNKDIITNRDTAFMVSETIRSHVFKNLHQEIPYATHITVEKIESQQHRTDIQAVLWVEKPNQKAIAIGNQGSMIKRIGTGSRIQLCKLLETKVNLKLWVNIKKDWSNDSGEIAKQNLDGE